MLTPDITGIPTTEPLRREWIKFQLRARGSSLTKVGRRYGVSRFAAPSALQRPYPRMERAIAKTLGLDPQQIWPERYNADGTSARPMGRRPYKSINKNNSAHRAASIQAGAGG